MKWFARKQYEVVEVCKKHGIKVVRVYVHLFEALSALKAIAEKYKHSAFYRAFGYGAAILVSGKVFERPVIAG